jgi:hypothetical protein
MADHFTIEDLISVGFKDKSPDRNGLAYRKDVNSIYELCCYTSGELRLRLQTINTGSLINLDGVWSFEDVQQLWLLLTNEEITSSCAVCKKLMFAASEFDDIASDEMMCLACCREEVNL